MRKGFPEYTAYDALWINRFDLWIVLLLTLTAAVCSEAIKIDLNGAWEMAVEGSSDWSLAQVPGCNYTDLFAAGKIPDPFFRNHEKQLQWVSDQGWTYRRSFDVSPEILQREYILLHCEGLDTFAAIYINGVLAGKADNMFRSWKFDSRSFLKPGKNTLQIHFDSCLPLMREKHKIFPLRNKGYPGVGYVRKAPCNFGWDWGPTLITCGIWRNISLVAFDGAQLDDVLIEQDHTQSGQVNLEVRIQTQISADLFARVSVIAPDHAGVDATTCEISEGRGSAHLEIASPQLWWPLGMGRQPLYTVRVELFSAENELLDATTRRIGLRTMQVKGESSMYFTVNGHPFFAKGANWIPSDVFPSRVTPQKLQRYVADAAAVHMNFLRLWGGGYYEEDALLDLCDEMGICVWVDFKFSGTAYPSFDAAFLDSVRLEVQDNLRRLRHHPSIAIWCGNNEIELKKRMNAFDYSLLFCETIGDEVRKLCPQAAYVTSSPNQRTVHYWGVWHDNLPFETFRDVHGFIAEFGFQSFPVPATVNAFTLPEDRDSVYSPIMKWHERSHRRSVYELEDGTIGTDLLMGMIHRYFRAPKDFEHTLWLSQITQAYGIEYGVEGWRREMPKSMGCLYWQYNDTWPGTSWSSVDYFGRWKALHYRARHFFAPLLISGEFDAKRGKVAVWVTNDRLQTSQAKLIWRITDLAGEELMSKQQSVEILAAQSSQVAAIDLLDLLQQYKPEQLLVWLQLRTLNDQLLSDPIVLLEKPKNLELLNPQLRAVVRRDEDTQFTVTVHSDRPALWVWLDVSRLDPDARYADNFFHLAPGSSKQCAVKLTRPATKDAFLQALRLRSLYDTYAPSS